MKSFRWTILLALLIGLLVTFTVFDFKRSEKQDKKSEEEKNVLRLSLGDITRIEIDGGSFGPIILEHPVNKGPTESEWQLISPLKDLADAQAIQTFNISLNGEKIVQTVVEGDDIVLDTYGLKASPEHQIKELKLTTKDGKNESVRIGSVKAYDNNLYAQIDQDKKVYLVASNWDPMLSKLPKDFRDKHVFRFATNGLKPAEVARIEIKQGDSSLVLERGAKDKKWKIASGALDFPLDQSKVDYYFDELKGVRVQDFVEPDKTVKGALAKHGLDKPALQVRLYKEGHKVADYEVKFSALEKVGATKTTAPIAFVVSSDLPDIASVSKPGPDSLRKTAQSFYDKRRPFEFQAADVERIEIQSPELKNVFQKKGETWTVVDAVKDHEVDSMKISMALQALGHMEALRILQTVRPGQLPSTLNSASKIVLVKKSGEPALTFLWGDSLTEKANAVQPEAKYFAAKTDKADVLLGVAEKDIKQLDIAAWLKTVAAPVASPTPVIVTAPKTGTSKAQ